ncbi:MAG: 23S rRNA (cytosine1962-C5)-methyltransferase [Bacillota bacterium]|nr:MAG: 23S rRNA (cytosine1962-C5)-methyltransferase [Bacillota bacterium]MBS3949589.1 class I SAM-dependent rRNA methyltransferase [Peptococcaceae bacterium]
MYPTVYLRRDRRPRIESGHPWVYSSEIGHVAGNPEPGNIVKVLNHAGAFIGIGYINPQSQITVRLLTRQDEEINGAFFRRRINEALSLRRKVVSENNTAYRLVYGEADYLPGLTIDFYDRYASIQVLTLGLEKWTDTIVGAARELLDLQGVVMRNDVPVRELEGLDQHVVFAGEPFDTLVTIKENGFSMLVDMWNGQKTGYFLDQRENRAYIAPFVKGAEVLDCFSHTGSFAVHAAGLGAAKVTAVDISALAIEGVTQNARINNLKNIEGLEANAFDFLRKDVEQSKSYDVVMLDPPAFTKNKASIHSARRGYKEINLRALKLVRPGGYLITSSCSYHISRDEFLGVLAEAARDAHKQVKVVAIRGQAADHPILLAAQETSYLKFVLLQVF